MKIVVIGGTGLIGSKAVAILRQGGHEVLAASPNSGVNTIIGEGVRPQPSRGGGRHARPAPRRAIHRRNRPERQWLFSQLLADKYAGGLYSPEVAARQPSLSRLSDALTRTAPRLDLPEPQCASRGGSGSSRAASAGCQRQCRGLPAGRRKNGR